jgi:hypothetical protein
MEFDLICLNCIHYNVKEKNCKAFDEIPYEIYVGLNEHSEPLPDQDNKIVFEPIEKQ